MTIYRQRAKVNASLAFAQESTFGADTGITTMYLLNLNAASGYKSNQDRKQIQTWKGKGDAHKSVLGRIMAGGKVPLNLDPLTAGRLWRTMVGSSGYLRPGGGTTKLHDFFKPTVAGALNDTCQLQDNSLETPAIYTHSRGNMISDLGLTQASDGGAVCDATFMGVGDEVQAALATGANLIDEGFIPMNYIDGELIVNGVNILGMQSFNFNLGVNITRTEGGFTGGKAASLIPDVFTPSGNLGLLVAAGGSTPESDFNFYNYAVLNQTIPIEGLWCSGPKATADYYVRCRVPGTKWTRGKFTPGGPGGLTVTQPYTGEEYGNLAAEMMADLKAPFTITTGVNDKFAVKIDGGATVTVTLTPGTYADYSSVVTQLQANGTLNTAATIDTYVGGRLRLTSKQVGGVNVGPLSSVQFDTTVANNCAATMGFTSASYAGYYLPWLVQFYNAKGTNY